MRLDRRSDRFSGSSPRFDVCRSSFPNRGRSRLLFGSFFTATDMAVRLHLTQGVPPPSFQTEQITTWS